MEKLKAKDKKIISRMFTANKTADEILEKLESIGLSISGYDMESITCFPSTMFEMIFNHNETYIEERFDDFLDCETFEEFWDKWGEADGC